MKVTDLRDKTADELKKELIALQKELFNLRMQRVTGEVTQTHLFQKARRDIARIKMILSEREGS